MEAALAAEERGRNFPKVLSAAAPGAAAGPGAVGGGGAEPRRVPGAPAGRCHSAAAGQLRAVLDALGFGGLPPPRAPSAAGTAVSRAPGRLARSGRA